MVRIIQDTSDAVVASNWNPRAYTETGRQTETERNREEQSRTERKTEKKKNRERESLIRGALCQNVAVEWLQKGGAIEVP